MGNPINVRSPYNKKPDKEGGVLNIGAGNKPVEGAYNIDPLTGGNVEGVFPGTAEDLSNILSESQRQVRMENPYKYEALNPEVYRVLESGGEVVLQGNMSNKFFNKYYKMSDTELNNLGYQVVSRSEVPTTGFSTNGKPLTKETYQLILKKS